jgi:microcystin-dependent protein
MEPFIGQIQLFGFNFAPKGWASCDGGLLPIGSYSALFSLLGTYYGGNGQTTFGLPDLRGRAPMHFGTGPGLTPRPIGERAGTEAVTLTTNQIPAHGHGINGSAAATSKSPSALVPGFNSAAPAYGPPDGTKMAADMVDLTGGMQAHDNMQPYLAVNYCIALEGIYPTRP